MTTIEEVTKWVSTAKKGQEAMYYKGFFVFDSFRRLSNEKVFK